MLGWKSLELARKYEGLQVSFNGDIVYYKHSLNTYFMLDRHGECLGKCDLLRYAHQDTWEIHKCTHKKSHYENNDGEFHCVICGVWQSSTNLNHETKPDRYPKFKPVSPGYYSVGQFIDGKNTSKELYFDGKDWIDKKPIKPVLWEDVEKPKLITWYRPKVVWYKEDLRPSGSDLRFYYSSKKEAEDFFGDTHNILEWETIEAPETFGECE